VATALFFGGSVFYFYILPIFGIIYGIRAMMRGFVIGGGIGLGLNVLAGLASLTAAGILNPGG
jgi:heme/copper-type cytochrome/quinol oxidase subunit 1